MTSTSSSARKTAAGELTLTQLISALEIMGINVVSPREEIKHEAEEKEKDKGKTLIVNLLKGSACVAAAAASLPNGDVTVNELMEAIALLGIDPFKQGRQAAEEKKAAEKRAAEENTLSGFTCAKCNLYNLIRPAKETWYTVTVGSQVGVFQGWHSVSSLVSGISGAVYKKYKSSEEANAAFDEAMDAGLVRRV